MNIVLLAIYIIIFSTVWLFCLSFSKPASIFYALDEVTNRSLHTQPKPRTGGVAVVSVIILAWLISLFFVKYELFHYFVMVGLIILSVVSYIDDRNSVSSLIRLMVHVLVAALMVYGLFQMSGHQLADIIAIGNWFVVGVFLILITVWSINLYNFMDGADGLAGGMGVIGFSCLAWFGWAAENQLYSLLAIAIATVNLGFLAHNFPPAKIFMGDVGSTVMGYLMAFFSFWGIQATIFSWWTPLLIFSPFIIDATVTLFRRMCARERFWEAHKSHYYQKLVQIGLGHAKTAIAEYVLMFSVACSSIMLHLIDSSLFTVMLLVAWVVIYFCIIVLVGRLSNKSGVMG